MRLSRSRQCAGGDGAPLWFSLMESHEAVERFEKAESQAEARESFGKRRPYWWRCSPHSLLWQARAPTGLRRRSCSRTSKRRTPGTSTRPTRSRSTSTKTRALSLPKLGATHEAKKLISANDNKYIPNQARLMPNAHALDHDRDIAHERHNYYQISEAAFQLAIVLCSIAIVARVLWLVFAGGGLGVVGLLALLNGFLFYKPGH